MTRLDWTKPVNSLIHKLQKAGLEVQAVDDGGGIIRINTASQLKGRQVAVEAVTSVDCSHIILNNQAGEQAKVCIVLGNDPEEIAADWACNSAVIGQQLEGAVEAFISQWEGKKCPKVAA
jgi:hypothetical protein